MPNSPGQIVGEKVSEVARHECFPDRRLAGRRNRGNRIESEADLARLAHSLGLVVRRGDRPTIDDTHKENP